MCIRDRDIGTDEVDLADIVAEIGLIDGDRLDSGPPAGRKAVSYTHLRAHETVLDLVCRLLLEKKKDSQTQHMS